MNMKDGKISEQDNWGIALINRVVHPFTVFATPALVLILIIYLVICNFREGIYVGIRSFAGFLFPLILVTFIFKFQKELLEKLGKIPTLISFGISLFTGIVVMIVVQGFERFLLVPIVELVLSGSFSILVFSYASLRGNKMLSYYYGMISGFLFYIIFWGFPALK